MENFELQTDGKYKCKTCHSIVKKTSIKTHLNTKKHNNIKIDNKYENDKYIVNQNVSENTLKNRKTADKKVNKIITDLNITDINKDYMKIYDELNKTLKPQSVLTYMVDSVYNKLNKVEGQKLMSFIKEQKNKILMDNYKKGDEPIKVNEIDNKIVQLYLLLPLRISEFVKLKINRKIDTYDNNHIDMIADKIILYNTKNNKIHRIPLQKQVKDFIMTNFSHLIDTDKQIYDKSLRQFERLLGKTGYNSQQIRRDFAKSGDIVEKANVLNHKISTHVINYMKQQKNRPLKEYKMEDKELIDAKKRRVLKKYVINDKDLFDAKRTKVKKNKDINNNENNQKYDIGWKSELKDHIDNIDNFKTFLNNLLGIDLKNKKLEKDIKLTIKNLQDFNNEEFIEYIDKVKKGDKINPIFNKLSNIYTKYYILKGKTPNYKHIKNLINHIVWFYDTNPETINKDKDFIDSIRPYYNKTKQLKNIKDIDPILINKIYEHKL